MLYGACTGRLNLNWLCRLLPTDQAATVSASIALQARTTCWCLQHHTSSVCARFLAEVPGGKRESSRTSPVGALPHSANTAQHAVRAQLRNATWAVQGLGKAAPAGCCDAGAAPVATVLLASPRKEQRLAADTQARRGNL